MGMKSLTGWALVGRESEHLLLEQIQDDGAADESSLMLTMESRLARGCRFGYPKSWL
jgi:hypothetical protein